MTMTLLRQLRDFHRTAKEAVALAESLQCRMNCASYEYLELIHDYDDFAERLIDNLNLDSDQMTGIQAEARRLRQIRMELELDYASNDTLAQKRQRARTFVALFATLLLVGIAALAAVYTAGYVRGESTAMVQADTAGTVGRGLRSAPQSQHNETALSGDCGGQGTARPTDAATDCDAEEVTR